MHYFRKRLKVFCNETEIHGMKNLFEPGRHYTERFMHNY